MSTQRRRPVSVGSMVPKVLEELGIEGAAVVMRILEHWDAAVGPEIARHARPSVLRGATLEVTADSSVWCQQVQFLRPRILEALRERLGADAPSDLRTRVGSVTG